MTSHRSRRIVSALLAALLVIEPLPAFAAVTEISTIPMSSLTQSATPNVIFGIDDSGSMDFEVLTTGSGGEFWWDTSAKRFWDASGKLNFNSGGTTSNSYHSYEYVFPLTYGTSSTDDRRRYRDDADSGYVMPPIDAYAAARSAAYNPLYYNPDITYTPWVDAYMGSSTVSFSNATPSAARAHPYFPTSGSPITYDLTATFDSTHPNWKSQDWTFRMKAGMVIPFSTIAGTVAKKTTSGGSWSTTNPWTNKPSGSVVVDYTIPSGEQWDVAIPFYPATYWVKQSTCPTGATCVTAPDGTNKLVKFEIKASPPSGQPAYPGGRSYTAEMQNFANWFQYHRKRKLLMGAAFGATLSQVKGLRIGYVYFHNLNTVTMYDMAATSDSANAKVVIGAAYKNPSSSGTPTRETLAHIGSQFKNNSSIIQYGCQRNNAMILTDGYAEANSVSVPSYDSTLYVNTQPYKTTYSPSLAALAASLYTNNPRPDLPTGLLRYDPSDTAPNVDKNPNLHVNTYGLTLGALGTIYGTSAAAATNPFLNYPAWPNPTVNYSPTAVDDLWHATINGRGAMYKASDSKSLTSSLRAMVAALLAQAGSDASVAVSNVNLSSGDSTVYVSSYNGQSWSGELAAYPISVATGQVTITAAARIWGARDLLTARTPDSRIIATFDGTVGIPFQVTDLTTAGMLSKLNNPSASPADGAAVLAFIRGDRSLEGPTYRTRTSLLGDIVSAAPVVMRGAAANFSDSSYASFAESIKTRQRVIFEAANDGMLHAFDAATGVELWGYIPGAVVGKLNKLTNIVYDHEYFVDAAPTVADVEVGGWRTMLVGGLRAGGSGYYALDVTNPRPTSEVALASMVKWEFPNATTSSTHKNNLGLTFGQPILAKTKAYGWVVLVTSGYNNTSGDGKGHLFVLDPSNGSVIKDLATSAGSASSPSGLAHISAYSDDPQRDPYIDYVYGGDLMGNVWRFDLSGDTTASWNVARLASLVDSNGDPQPITVRPELALVGTKRLVVVTTGKLLGPNDISSTQKQSIYAMIDDKTATPTIANVRTALTKKTVTVGSGGIRNIPGDLVDFSAVKGWYFDFPGTGERGITDPVIAPGAVVFSTNQPSSTACDTTSYLYVVGVTSGGQMPAGNFAAGETAWSGKVISDALATAPVVAQLPSGEMRGLTHASTTSVISTRLPIVTSSGIKRITWRRILR